MESNGLGGGWIFSVPSNLVFSWHFHDPGRRRADDRPDAQASEPSERPENKPSYSFNGAVNTTAQGHPVPVGYGRLVVGSAVISAGIDVDEVPA